MRCDRLCPCDFVTDGCNVSALLGAVDTNVRTLLLPPSRKRYTRKERKLQSNLITERPFSTSSFVKAVFSLSVM